jgi:undecaprenyl-diphosphatase
VTTNRDVDPAGSTVEVDRRSARRVTGGIARRWLAAYALMTAVCVGLGLLVTHASIAAGVRRGDASVDRWFVRAHAGPLDSLTSVGSKLAETPTVIAAGLIAVAVLWWRRRDLEGIGILTLGLLLEVCVFVSTTLFVDRPRPPVRHLDAAPPTSSFPSGHTAAAIALYVGLVVVLHRRSRPTPTWFPAVAAVLLLVPVVVGLSRLYRGMHHPTDVIVGVLLGTTSLVVACWIVARARSDAARPVASDGGGSR